MKFLANAFIKPFLAIVFFLGFGGSFVFLGFQSVIVDLERNADHVIHGKLMRQHFLGLYTVATFLDGVTEAKVESRMGTTANSLPEIGTRVVIPDFDSKW